MRVECVKFARGRWLLTFVSPLQRIVELVRTQSRACSTQAEQLQKKLKNSTNLAKVCADKRRKKNNNNWPFKSIARQINSKSMQ